MLPGSSWTTLQSFLPVQCYPKSIKTTLNRIAFCAMFSGASWTTLHKFFTYAMLSQQEYEDNTFSYAILRVAFWATCTRFYLWNVVLTVLGQHWTGFFLCNVVPRELRQHWTGCLLEQCCPKRIKTTLNRMFSWAMLSGASRTTLHRVCTCVILSQEYKDNIEQDFFLCNVVWSLLGKIV